jgi:hypothetical protein
VYTLIALCRLESTGEPHVIYTPSSNEFGEYWCPPLAEWAEEVEPGKPRFVEIRE